MLEGLIRYYIRTEKKEGNIDLVKELAVDTSIAIFSISELDR
jgi:hypothetical protein